jgi:Rrf2 family iron-sulfur cluster assembly transcriptional regulator
MSMLNQQSQVAISTMGRLAEVFDEETTRLSAAEIAKSRNLTVPFVAKVATMLSQAGLIQGTPGPGGGYRLARKPNEITLREITRLFERADDYVCPYGPDYCGTGPECPLHDQIKRVQEELDNFLERTTLIGFTTTSKQV